MVEGKKVVEEGGLGIGVAVVEGENVGEEQRVVCGRRGKSGRKRESGCGRRG